MPTIPRFSTSNATLYSLKSLNLNEIKVASYDKLKAKTYEAVSEKTRLEGQLNQAIMDKDHYKAERNLSRNEKAELDEKITELERKIIELELKVASVTNQLETEYQQAEDASRAFYESNEYINLENTNINLGREEVFYTIWRKYPDLDFSFLGEGVLGVIEGFKAKLAKKVTPIIEIPNDET